MATPVEVPKLGNTVEECIVTKWRKQKGDSVAAGDVVAEIETDKATFEVAAPVDGTVLETFFDQGTLVPVFTNLFVIGQPGEAVDSFRPQSAPAAAASASASIEVKPAAEPIAAARAVPQPAPAASSVLSPRARRFAEERDFHPASVTGSGPGGRVLEEDLRTAYYSTPRTSSAAKKHMEAGGEARGSGSGTAGMILSSDLGPPATRISNIRERIARRMRESLAATAQYTLNASADASGLLALRARVKASKGLPDININDLVAFCTIKALLEMPDLNAEFIDGKIYRHPEIHLGFACDTPRGLIVPVVRDAQAMEIGELAIRMKELTAQAVQGSISADDLAGATFTITNLGGLGIESFTPLINPPQVAILGVDAIQLKPVRRDGRVEFVDSIGLSLTCDHQIIDGAPGARFLKVVREKIENVEKLCTI
jgi:pyruvate dehydrogenase E2 component (dihydrolipoyllysine-residue acetyltransferase)